MRPNAVRPLPRRDPTKPSVVPPPTTADSGVVKKPARIRRHETTAPFSTAAPSAAGGATRTSEIRELTPRASYKPPAPASPPEAKPRASVRPSSPVPASHASVRPSAPTPRASLADIPKKGAMSMPRISMPPAPAVPFAAAPRRDPTPVVSKSAPPPPPAAATAYVAPVLLGLETTELPLEEIDYEAAYGYDPVALEARLRRRSSILPPALVDVANDVRHVADDVRRSLAPDGRAEAARELRGMKRVTLRGLAALLRRVASAIEAYA